MNRYKVRFAAGILFFFGLTHSSFCQKSSDPMKIALSKATTNYITWLHKGDSLFVPVNMYGLSPEEAVKELEECSGLLITGGEDVHPSLYGKEDQLSLCKDIDRKRDTLEQALIRKALHLKMPVLGICRGEQIINVTLGGSLIVDIPAYFKAMDNGQRAAGSGHSASSIQPSASSIQHPASSIQHQCPDYLNCHHKVNVESISLFRSIVGCDSGFVASNHHQAVDRLAPGLRYGATSPDGLIETIEWQESKGKSFLIGVQWHPERMDTSNCMSGNILKEFLSQSAKFQKVQIIK